MKSATLNLNLKGLQLMSLVWRYELLTFCTSFNWVTFYTYRNVLGRSTSSYFSWVAFKRASNFKVTRLLLGSTSCKRSAVVRTIFKSTASELCLIPHILTVSSTWNSKRIGLKPSVASLFKPLLHLFRFFYAQLTLHLLETFRVVELLASSYSFNWTASLISTRFPATGPQRLLSFI